VAPGFALLATELLDWGEADLQSADQLQTIPEVVLAEYGETLRPTHGVPKLEGEGLQALVLDLTALGEWGRDFDKPWNPTGHGWDATPQQRLERLLKETEHPIGILFNGAALRLVHAPRGESSGWLTMPLKPMAEVAGRPMLGALELLLGVDRLFGGAPVRRLPALLAASRKNQSGMAMAVGASQRCWLAPRLPAASYLDPVMSGDPSALSSKTPPAQGAFALPNSGFDFLC
jgi:hypothetical protein